MKKNYLLLVILFLVFVSLGIPDGALGAAWPAIALDVKIANPFAAILSSLIFAASFISSLSYAFLLKRLSFSKIVLISVLFTITGVLIFSMASSRLLFSVAAIVMGLGAGCIDTAVNDFSTKHFSIKVINMLHGCWGIGISLGAYIVSATLFFGSSWHVSYLIIALLQTCVLLTIFSYRHLFISTDFTQTDHTHVSESDSKLPLIAYLHPLFYFCYGIEYVCGLYLSSYLIIKHGVSIETASFIVGVYWSGLMLGRFAILITANILSNYQILITSILISIVAVVMLSFVNNNWSLGLCSFLIGLGYASLYPTMMYQTKYFYNATQTSKIISLQVSAAMLGIVVLPNVYCFFFERISYYLFNVLIAFNLVIMGLIIMVIYQKRTVVE